MKSGRFFICDGKILKVPHGNFHSQKKLDKYTITRKAGGMRVERAARLRTEKTIRAPCNLLPNYQDNFALFVNFLYLNTALVFLIDIKQ
jgi:hypothetical protein